MKPVHVPQDAPPAMRLVIEEINTALDQEVDEPVAFFREKIGALMKLLRTSPDDPTLVQEIYWALDDLDESVEEGGSLYAADVLVAIGTIVHGASNEVLDLIEDTEPDQALAAEVAKRLAEDHNKASAIAKRIAEDPQDPEMLRAISPESPQELGMVVHAAAAGMGEFLSPKLVADVVWHLKQAGKISQLQYDQYIRFHRDQT